jgi:hypothetical protein
MFSVKTKIHSLAFRRNQYQIHCLKIFCNKEAEKNDWKKQGNMNEDNSHKDGENFMEKLNTALKSKPPN